MGYKTSLSPFGLEEDTYIYAFQYPGQDGPDFLHFLMTKTSLVFPKERGYKDGEWVCLIFSTMNKGTFDRYDAYPRGNHKESYYDLLQGFYEKQFGSAKQVDEWLKQVDATDTIPVELQEGILLGMPRSTFDY